MQANDEKAKLERVLAVFYLIFVGLGLTCERIQWYFMCTWLDNLTIHGFHWNILSSLFQIVFLIMVFVSKEKLSRACVWSAWSYYLIFGCNGLFYQGKKFYEAWKNSQLPNYHFSDDFWFVTIKGIVLALLILTAELLIITKYRSKKVLITQLIVFGIIFIHNSFYVYGREMRMLLHKEPYNYYSGLQSYCNLISTFLFLFWIYVKKNRNRRRKNRWYMRTDNGNAELAVR